MRPVAAVVVAVAAAVDVAAAVEAAAAVVALPAPAVALPVTSVRSLAKSGVPKPVTCIARALVSILVLNTTLQGDIPGPSQ